MILDVPRCGQPQQVMANVILRSAAHGDTTLKDLRGVDRFTAAARARVSGLFVQVPDGDKGPLAAHLEMASLPWAEMGIGRDVTLRDWSMLTRWCEQQGLTACH
jgi:hypothetical protein